MAGGAEPSRDDGGRGGGSSRSAKSVETLPRGKHRGGAGKAAAGSREQATQSTEAKGARKPAAEKKAATKPKKNAWFPTGKKKWGDIAGDDEKDAPGLLDTDSNPVDPAVRRAVECTIRRKAVSMWGFIIRVKSRVATVVHGLDSLLTVRLPTKGKNASLGVGSAVGVYQRTRQHMDGSVTTTHHLANFSDGAAPKLKLSDLPRLRAVVLRVGEEGYVGQVVVPITGARCALNAPQLGRLTPGSSFSFIPTFEDGLMCIGRIPDDCGLKIAEGGLTKLPLTSADLLEGFCCPEERLQAVVKRKYGVDLMPFVGGPLSCFQYSPGNEVLEEFRRYKKLKQLANANLKDLEEVLIKASLYKQDRAWSDDEVRDRIQAPHKNLYVPTSSNAEAFAKWIKRDLNRAAKGGPTQRLQAVVGVFVDGDCTLGSLYNTESVPYFNMDKFPWARSFTLVATPLSCYTMGAQGSLIPSVGTAKGKKILLVELDSQNNNSGTLPKPTLLSLRTGGPGLSIQLNSGNKKREFVLISLPEDDPRCQVLIDNYGSSIYRRQGKSLILARPFNSLLEAEEYVLGMAESPMGMFCMLKRDFYNHKTLTLTCSGKKPVLPEELYYLTHAMGILPIGGHRYRISTNMGMLEAAQVLNFQNRYIQKDRMKYICLRDDNNGYVKLNTDTAPKQVKLYYRLVPPRALDQQVQSGKWYCMSNLPNGVTSHILLEALRDLPWWPSSIKEIIVDDVKHQPDVWFRIPAETEANIPLTISISNRPVAIVRSGVPRSVLLAKNKRSTQKGPLKTPQHEVSVAWRPPRLTKDFVARRAKKDRRVRKLDSGQPEARPEEQKAPAADAAASMEEPGPAQRQSGEAVPGGGDQKEVQADEEDCKEGMEAVLEDDEKDKDSNLAASSAVQARGPPADAGRREDAKINAQGGMECDGDEPVAEGPGGSADTALGTESDPEYVETDNEDLQSEQEDCYSDSGMDKKVRVPKRGRQSAGRSSSAQNAMGVREDNGGSPSGSRSKRPKPVQGYSLLSRFTKGLTDPLTGQSRN